MAKPKTASKPKATSPKSPSAKPKALAPRPERTPIKRKAKAVSDASVASDRLERLWTAVQEVREGRRDSPRTARLLAAGPPKLAQKVVEEAAEVAIEAVIGKRESLVNESVDLIYNVVALWNGLGVRPQDIWAEMDRREAALGMSEKLPKTDDM